MTTTTVRSHPSSRLPCIARQKGVAPQFGIKLAAQRQSGSACLPYKELQLAHSTTDFAYTACRAGAAAAVAADTLTIPTRSPYEQKHQQ